MANKAVNEIWNVVYTGRFRNVSVSFREDPDEYDDNIDRMVRQLNNGVNAARRGIDYRVLIHNPRAPADKYYYSRHLVVRKGESVKKVVTQFWKDLFNDDGYKDDEEDYDEDDEIEILGWNAEPTGVVYEGNDDGDDDLRAHHLFQKNHFEKQFSIGRMVMRDFSCCYEALIMIYHMITFACARPDSNSDWIAFVYDRYIRESAAFQDYILEGNVDKCIQIFYQEYQHKVGVFNAYQASKELDTLLTMKNNGVQLPDYFLVYWQEHVFPASQEQVFQLAQHINEKYNMAVFEPKIFCVIPSFYENIMSEMRLYAIMSEEQRAEWYWAHLDAVEKLDMNAIYACSIVKRNKIMREKFYQQVFTKLHNIQGNGVNNRRMVQWIYDTAAGYNEYKGGDYFIKSLQGVVEMYRRVQPFFTDVNQQWVKDKVIAREKYFDQVGLIGIDIEAALDTSLTESNFVLRPYMLTVIGRLMRIITREDGSLETELVQVDECFIGLGQFDCVDKFINWLFKGKFMWADYDLMQFRAQKTSKTRPKLFNYIFAHNGFGFDYRYFYEKLHLKCSEFKMIGDVNKAKSLQGGGLFLYDFSLIYSMKLKDLAETFFKGQADMQKLENENVVALPVEKAKNWLTNFVQKGVMCNELRDMMVYCKRDSLIVYKMAEQFFRFTFTTPFGHGFLPKMFYHSVSALSWDMWHYGFMKNPIFVNRHTQAIEQYNKMGGFTCVYRNQTGFGIVIDVNSFYPAIMMNMMPLWYKTLTAKAVEKYEQLQLVTRGNYRQLVKHHSLYRIKFKFPANEPLPTIATKVDGSLVMVQYSDNFDTDDTVDAVWVFGETVRTAVELADAQVKMFEVIEFIPGEVHAGFIDYCYNKRLDSRSKVDNIFWKFMMNTCFGKHGQLFYMKNFFGTWWPVRDLMSQLVLRKDIVQESIDLKRIMSDNVPLYELKYRTVDDDLNHKGATLRISSFIMEMARTYLMRIKHAIVKELGIDSIVYCDTDSVFISFDKADPMGAMYVQYLYDQLNKEALEIDEECRQYEHLPVTLRAVTAYVRRQVRERYYVQRMRKIFHDSWAYKAVMNIRLKDVRRVDDEMILMPLIDNTRLGASKIEKEIILAKLTGYKYYGYVFIADGRVYQSVRAKAIPEKHRKMMMIDALSFYYNEDGELVPPMFGQVVQCWRRMGAGVVIYDKYIVVKPTLYKRNHNYISRTSRPWLTASEYIENKRQYLEEMEKKKYQFKKLNQQVIELVQHSQDYLAASEVQRRQMEMNMNMRQVKAEDRQVMIESRKRFMIYLPKFKYNFIQDYIFTLLNDNEEVRLDASMYLQKCIAIVQKAIFAKKLSSKKAMHWWLTDERELYGYEWNKAYKGYKEDIYRGTLNSDQAARVIVFCLYSLNVAQQYQMDIPVEFYMICDEMSKLIEEYVDILESDGTQASGEVRTRHWRKAIVCGLQFLVSPIHMQANSVQLNAIPLHEPVKVTNLWRYFNNFVNFHLQIYYTTRAIELEDVKQLFKRGNVYRAEFDEERLNFNFRLELPIIKQDVYRISQIVDTHGKRGIEQEEKLEGALTLYTDRQRLPFMERVVYDEYLLTGVNAMVDIDYTKRRRYLTKMLLMTAYPKRVELGIDEDELQEFTLEIFTQTNLQVKESLLFYKIFGINGKGMRKVINQKDVIDFILLVQFIYLGGTGAVKVLKGMVKEWRFYTSSMDKVVTLIEVIQLLFHKTKMFGYVVGTTAETCSNRIKGFFLYLFEKVVMWPWDEHFTDADVRMTMDMLLLDEKLCTKEFRALVQTAVKEGTVQYEFGLRYMKRILEWLRPTPAMLARLSTILRLKYDVLDSGNDRFVDEGEERNKLLMKVMEEYQQVVDAYIGEMIIERRYQNRYEYYYFMGLAMADVEMDEEVVKKCLRIDKKTKERIEKERERFYDLQYDDDQWMYEFERRYQEEMEDFIVPDHSEGEQQLTLRDYVNMQQEMDRVDQYEKERLFMKRTYEQLFDEDAKSEDDEELFRHAVKRYKIVHKRMLRNPFFDNEAEEGEESDSGKLSIGSQFTQHDPDYYLREKELRYNSDDERALFMRD